MKTFDAVCALVRNYIFNAGESIPEGTDWNKIFTKAFDRESGDVDILTFRDTARADEILADHGIETKVKGHHSVFLYKGVFFENHCTVPACSTFLTRPVRMPYREWTDFWNSIRPRQRCSL